VEVMCDADFCEEDFDKIQPEELLEYKEMVDRGPAVRQKMKKDVSLTLFKKKKI
jgi:hypothetical protein